MSEEAEKQVHRYTGKDVDVVWDGRLCIHVGECGRATNELFVGGRDPWCQPDRADVEDVHEVVARCPTGALSVEARSEAGRREEVAAPNRLVVASNGPLYVSGDLDIDGAGDDQPSLGVRAALCRCGASKNKPFCDGAHDEVGFRDAGAVGESSSVDEPESGPLEIKRIKGGPLLATGPFSIVSGSGRDAWQGERAALCRCGASKNKPFCDGSHSKIEFDAD